MLLFVVFVVLIGDLKKGKEGREGGGTILDVCTWRRWMKCGWEVFGGIRSSGECRISQMWGRGEGGREKEGKNLTSFTHDVCWVGVGVGVGIALLGMLR